MYKRQRLETTTGELKTQLESYNDELKSKIDSNNERLETKIDSNNTRLEAKIELVSNTLETELTAQPRYLKQLTCSKVLFFITILVLTGSSAFLASLGVGLVLIIL